MIKTKRMSKTCITEKQIFAVSAPIDVKSDGSVIFSPDKSNKSSKRMRFRLPRLNFKQLVLTVIFKIFGLKAVSYKILDQDKWVDERIEKIIKINGFVELNRRGEIYLSGFTLLEVIRNERKVITAIKLKHDIDSVVGKPVKELVVSGKYTGLQRMITYFSKI